MTWLYFFLGALTGVGATFATASLVWRRHRRRPPAGPEPKP